MTAAASEAKIIAIDDDLVKVKQSEPNFIRIHIYLGTVCRSEVFDKARDFKLNKNDLLERFGIASKLPLAEQLIEKEKYCLKLVNGGLVDSNSLIFHDDRIMILPKEDFLRQQEVK
jgi:hypothetical protein